MAGNDYSHFDPYEDFAETFAAYFLDQMGEQFYGMSAASALATVSAKREYVQDLVDSL